MSASGEQQGERAHDDGGEGRRIAALYLPDLVCELVALPRESPLGVAGALALEQPLAVVLCERPDDMKPSSLIAGVSARARRLGVAPQQSVTEARALASNLDVRRLAPSALEAALGRFCELLLALCPLVSRVSPDTILCDITGVAHLAGSEEALLAELCERVRALGHRVRGAVASGPVAARAVARFSSNPMTIVPPGYEQAALSPLPLRALPIDDDTARWFLRVGVLTIGDLLRQHRASVSARLDQSRPEARAVLALLSGDDRAPLDAYIKARVVEESIDWDDPVEGREPLLFALRGLAARLAARLEGRAEAVTRAVIVFTLDASIAEAHGEPRERSASIDFPLPIAHAPELTRVLQARLEGITLAAPVRALRLVAAQITEAPRVQLDLSRDKTPSPDALPLLLAELSAELGESRVGVLALQDSHLPEKRASLVPLARVGHRLQRPRKARRNKAAAIEQMTLWPQHMPRPPARLLDIPVPIEGRLTKGSFVTIMHKPFTVQEVLFTERLDGVGWWSESPVSRDYAFVLLSAPEGCAEAWVMRDRKRKRAFVHGWFA